MKKQKKRVVAKKTTKSYISKSKPFKGGVDAGTVYGVLLLAIVVGGAYMMLGNIAPNLASPDNNQPVIINKAGDNSKNSNLQLKTFDAVTITPPDTVPPTPTDTPTPQPPAPASSGNSGSGSGSGGNGSCFVKGTKVLMADKTEKNIETVRPGDKVMGYDGKQSVVETVHRVESPVRDHHYDIKLVDGTVLGTTDDHPIYTEKGWAAINPTHAKKESPGLVVSNLVIGDKALKSNGHYVEIVSIKFYPGRTQTYNLKDVTGFNDYYANDVVVHNKGNGSGSGSGSGSGAGSGAGL